MYAVLISVFLHALLWGGSHWLSPPLRWSSPATRGPVFVTALKSPIVARSSKVKAAAGTESSPAASTPTVKSLAPESVAQAGNIAPAYPAEAERAGWEGEVLLHLYCDESGKVVESRVEKTSGYRSLDEAARSQSLAWKFLPA